MKKIALSIEQMKHLKELGVDCSDASLYYILSFGIDPKEAKEEDYQLSTIESEDKCDIPTFTLQDMLEILPKSVMYLCDDDTYTCVLTIQADSYGDKVFDEEIYYVNDYYKDESPKFSISALGWLDAVYNMLCWCAEKGYLKQK